MRLVVPLHGQQRRERRITLEVPWSAFRAIARGRESQFLLRGYRPRHVFAHRLYQLPKCGPDGYKLALAACGSHDLSAHWQLVLYADPTLLEEFPAEIFSDDDVMWHRQQFGLPGQVASATVVLDGAEARSLVHQSDLVQRIGRIPSHRSRIENRFKGWPHMLLNGLLAFALERGLKRLYTPTAELAMRHTDPEREVKRHLFERVYDRPVELFSPERGDGWWVIDVQRNSPAVVVPDVRGAELGGGRTVCICHDIERGHGHVDTDPAFARRAHHGGTRNLEEMLAVAASSGIAATYNVVGVLMPEVEGDLRAAGHSVAFHSYAHSSPAQLEARRSVAYSIT